MERVERERQVYSENLHPLPVWLAHCAIDITTMFRTIIKRIETYHWNMYEQQHETLNGWTPIVVVVLLFFFGFHFSMCVLFPLCVTHQESREEDERKLIYKSEKLWIVYSMFSGSKITVVVFQYFSAVHSTEPWVYWAPVYKIRTWNFVHHKNFTT